MTIQEAEIILKNYKEKSNIIKQIHSNKKNFYENWNLAFNIITVIASLLLTVLGFINKDSLYELFMKETNSTAIEKASSLEFFDFSFNTAVLFVLLISILNLIFRFQDKAFEHNRAIILFSNILRDISEIKITINSLTTSQLEEKISQISFKFSNVTDLITPHSDKDFFNAKEDYYKKRIKSKAIDNKYTNGEK